MHAGSGPRYTDWSHLRVPDGEREAAAPYIPAARKLLGFVMDEARRTGLKSHKIKRTLRDGTVIIAEKIGDIPRMTIVPKGGRPPIEIRTLEGFYFTRRIAALENHQPAILVEPTDEEDSEWTALFYGGDEVGFDLAPEDQRGTYIDVFGPKAKQPWQRLDIAGGMWVDRETKESVTWFRGYLGYWPMHYRHPITNYAPYVNIYGHLVYTTPFPEWRVLAAAKRDNWLYVMVCENLGFLNPPERPGTASWSGQVWASQPYTDDEYNYSLWRYPLSIETQPDTLIDTYRAGDHDETGEQLWSGSLELAYGAWSFNADCTNIVTMQLPRRAIFTFRTYRDETLPGLELWRISPDSFPEYPVQEAQRIALTISHGVGTPSVSLSQTDAPLIIAEEDGVVLTMQQTGHETQAPPHEVVTTYSKLEYICGDFSIVAFEAYVPFATFEPQLSRTIVYAHLPSKTFLFLKYAYGGGTLEPVNICYELYVDGEQVEITDDPYAVDTVLAEFPAGIERTMAHARYTVPWFGAYNDLATEWNFFNPLDAMTLLLGIIVEGRGAGPGSTGSGPNSQGYIIVGNPYIPFTARINSDSPYVTEGGIDRGAGAGGWSIAQYGGPGPTFAWEDANANAPAGYFNRGLYEATDASTNPYYCSFGSAATYEGVTLFALKAPVWAYYADEDGPNPYPFRETSYPFRWATKGDAREVIDAVDHDRLATDNILYYASYPVGHTGKPMKRQKTRFAA